jgi:hypothetical protein
MRHVIDARGEKTAGERTRIGAGDQDVAALDQSRSFPRPVRRDDIDILPGLEARVAQRCKDAERNTVILSDKALTA